MNKLSFEQLECINGGSWISDFCDWVGNCLQAAWDWVQSQAASLVFTYYTEYIEGIGTVYGVKITY